jgi:hypothetical protein
MKPLARAPKGNLTDEYHASQALIAELEARLVQLLVANASLEREIADRKRTEDEFRLQPTNCANYPPACSLSGKKNAPTLPG